MTWYNENWKKRIKINTKNAQVSAAYPWAMIYDTSAHLTGAEYNDFWSSIKADGADIRMIKADDETEVPRGVREFDTSEKEGLIYFKAEDISTSADVDFYIYFDNASADDYADDNALGMENVFSSDYKFYSTMADLTTSSIKDETSNENDGTKGAANNPVETTGLIGKAQDNVNTSSRISVSAQASINNIWSGGGTVIFTINQNTLSEGTAISKLVTDSAWSIALWDSGNKIRLFHRFTGNNLATETTSSIFSTDTNYHIVFTYNKNSNSNRPDIFIDGTKVSVTTTDTPSGSAFSDAASPLHLMNNHNSNAPLLGWLDEVSMIDGILSDDEIATISNNQSNNATFFDTGEIESSSTFNPAIARRRLLMR